MRCSPGAPKAQEGFRNGGTPVLISYQDVPVVLALALWPVHLIPACPPVPGLSTYCEKY